MDAVARGIMDTTPTLQTAVVTMRMHRARPDATVVLGADVEYEPDAVEAIPLRSASMYSRLLPRDWQWLDVDAVVREPDGVSFPVKPASWGIE